MLKNILQNHNKTHKCWSVCNVNLHRVLWEIHQTPRSAPQPPGISRLYYCQAETGTKQAHILGFPGGLAGKESTCNVGDLGLIPGLGRSPGEGHGNPLQYSCLENLHGQRSLVGYSPWGHKELDTTEQLNTKVVVKDKARY